MKIVNVMASSLDGYIALSLSENDDDRIKVGLSSPEDQDFLMNELSQSDAVVIGANSIRSNGRCADISAIFKRNPHWYIMTSKGLDKNLPFWRQYSVPRTLVSQDPEVPIYDASVKHLTYGEQNHVHFLINEMKKLNYKRVLLFGGSEINADYYNQNQVQELKLTLSPVIVASQPAPRIVAPKLTVPIQLSLVASHIKGNFVFLHYTVIGQS